MLVRVAAVGVCHTDIAYTDGSPPAAPFPLVAGHEGAGVIAAAGPGADGFAAGDRVVMSFSSCGRCRGCLAAGPPRCSSFRELNSGFGGPGGEDGSPGVTARRWRPGSSASPPLPITR